MTLESKALSFTAFAILAYIFSYFGWQLALLLVVAFALGIARDAKMGKQTLQALYLYIAYTVVQTIFGWIFSGLIWFASTVRLYGVASFLAGAQGFISSIVNILLLVLVLLAIFKLVRKEEPHLPVIGRLADLSLGLASPKKKEKPAAAYAPAQQQPYSPPPAATTAPAAPQSLPQAEQPQQQMPAQQPAPPPPAAPKADSDSWTCSCGKENTGNFCVACGNKRPV